MKYFLLFLLAIPSMVTAQPFVALKSDAQPREVTIGDRIQYNVTIIQSTDVALAPLPMTNTFGEFEILALSTSTLFLEKENKLQTTKQFVLTTFSTGALVIPGTSFLFTTIDGATQTVKSEDININVKSVLAEKGDLGNLQPLKGFFDFPSYTWVWILAGILGAILIIVIAFKYLKGGPKEVVTIEPYRPPEEIAWEQLHALEDKDFFTQGNFKEFYFQLSVIIREYLERRYTISALDRTTSELTTEFHNLKLSFELTTLLREFFDNGDLVKFAKFTPHPEEATNDLNRVKSFLNLTTPKIEVPTKDKAGGIPL